MSVRGEIIPGAARLRRLLPGLAREAAAEPRLSRKARGRLHVLRWSELHGGAVRATCGRFGWSTSTFLYWRDRYRRLGPRGLEDRSRRPAHVRQPTWKPELEAAALQLRTEYPRWGKDKLTPLLRVQGFSVSHSTVGRIIKRLRETHRLPPATLADPWAVRRHTRRPYAVRKPKSYLPVTAGDLVQVDTADIRYPGRILKHFTARDVVCKWDTVEVYHRATATAAAHFLDQLIARAPFVIRAIQVDGGSEFKAEFEELCEVRGIALFVLPPRSPKLNGCVERAQRTHKEEFYQVVDLPDSISDLRALLRAHEEVYNTVRPHQALGQITPLAWLEHHQKQKTDCSPEAPARFPNPYRKATT
jgi:transposase InsO family protein